MKVGSRRSGSNKVAVGAVSIMKRLAESAVACSALR